MATKRQNTTSKKMDTISSKIDQVTLSGLVVGLIVIIIGIISAIWIPANTGEMPIIIICVGLGILLSTFGSTGVIKHRNVTITGGAVIIFVLIYGVVILRDRMNPVITHGTLTGNFENAEIEIIGDTNQALNGAKIQRGKCYRFVVIGYITRPVFEIIITFRKNPLSVKEGEGDGEVRFESIKSSKINSHVDKKEKIEWRFLREKDKYIIKDHLGETVAEKGLPIFGYSNRQIEQNNWLILRKAFAQDLCLRSLQDVFVDLSSGSSEVRREARGELARNINNIPPMMKEFKKYQNIYQVRLGILEAMNEMLMIDKKSASKISQKLAPDDLDLIVKCLNDRDLTIRIAVSYLLYDLGDPRVVPLVVKSAREADSSEYLYLHLVAIKGAFERLSDSEKRSTKEQFFKIIEARPPTDLEKVRNMVNNLK